MGDAQPFPLADGVVPDTAVLAEDLPRAVDNVALEAFAPENVLQVAAVEILALFFVMDGESFLPGDGADPAFREFPQREKRRRELFLGQAV